MPLAPRSLFGCWIRGLLVLLQGSIGQWGESQALRHLQTTGMTVLRRNWRSKHLEADLILLDGRTIVIAEVKTRHISLQQAFPAHANVTPQKMTRLRRIGRRFLNNNGPFCRRFGVRNCRIDVVEVYYRKGLFDCRVKASIFWFRNVA
jgi:putative endonuclease